MTRSFPLILSAAFLAATSVSAQKRVLSYPFQFEKSLLAKGDYDAYFLDNAMENSFSLVLKDNKKVEYVLVDKNFKVISKFGSEIGSSVFDVKNLKDCTGGTVSGHLFHFFYPEAKGEYQEETVDFDGKSASHKKLMELGKDEKNLASFSDNNVFYVIASNDKAKSISISTVNGAGEFNQKTIPFPVPADASKDRDKISEYLQGLKVMKGSEFPDLSNAIKPAKLFTSPDKLVFLVNDGDRPAHLVTISLPSLTLSEKKIDYSGLIGKEEKGKVYISSFLKDNQLFSLVLNKKNIRIVVNDVESEAVLNKIEINDDAALDQFADGPTAETRMGKRESGKPVTDVKKLIREFTRGTEGLMVTENGKGQLVLTAGTYDLVPVGGSSGGGWQGGFEHMPGAPVGTGPMVWNSNLYYRPGVPSYTRTDARFYKTTFFKLLLDPKTYKVARGRVPMPVPDQIKDYMDTIDKKAKATNQFAIGKTQYYGYYDRDALAYVIDQIRITM